jgi:hypothetical protein
MAVVNVTTPIVLTPATIPTEETTYNVQPSYSSASPAITIEGDWKPNQNPFTEDRRDGRWPNIIINCDYKCKGLRIYAVDNADFSNIEVNESNGYALEISAMRQCAFNGSVRIARCTSTDAIMRITGDPNRYSSNMIDFRQIICMANDAPRTIEFITAPGAKNRTRIITISQLCCHPDWASLNAQFPDTVPFAPRARTHIWLDADDVTVPSFNFRLDPLDPTTARAIFAAPECRRVVFLNGQILRLRTDNPADFVEGPINQSPSSLAATGRPVGYKSLIDQELGGIAGPIVVNPFSGS